MQQERFKPPYPYNLREEMDYELIDRITMYKGDKRWAEGISPVSLLLNSAGHPDRDTAVNLVVGDVYRAINNKTPTDILKFAVGQVIKWRQILITGDPTNAQGSFTGDDLKKELKGKISERDIQNLFGSE